MMAERKGGFTSPEREQTLRYALISVSDKSGIEALAKEIQNKGYIIISSGGTAKVLNEANIEVTPVEAVTKNPEAFDGRMKTISFQMEGGILFDRENEDHVKEAKELGIPQIDLVVCNFYPFEKTVADKDVTFDELVESIDVGGPTMVRAAAKNYKNVLVVTDPSDYDMVAEALQDGSVTLEMRQDLAAKAFATLSFYDAQIAAKLNTEVFPKHLTIPGRFTKQLRYGDNPHEEAALYLEPNTPSPLAKLQKHEGRELSQTNLTDIDAGIQMLQLFNEPVAVVIKHNSPCGIATGENAQSALGRAIEADPLSAFGGVVVTNMEIDKETAAVLEKLKKTNHVQMDIIAAAGIDDEALERLHTLRKTTGIYTFGNIERSISDRFRFVEGGVIKQRESDPEESFEHWSIATEAEPTSLQLSQMQLGWKFISRVRSNTVLVMDKEIPMTRGIGSGQTSRIGATEIALKNAGEHAKGSILISDSFFPFDDSVQVAGEHGIKAILQQGGSIRDKDSIDAANELGIAMVFTNHRAFWH